MPRRAAFGAAGGRGTAETVRVPDRAERERLHVEAARAAGLARWPHNALRHTFCTMLISFYADAARVANWSRHSSPKELYQSYVTKQVSREEAERFLAIVP